MKAGTNTTGLFHPIGGVGGANLVILCEGWATGMTIYQSLNGDVPVACVGSCNNFLAVAAAMFDSELCSRVLIMGDA